MRDLREGRKPPRAPHIVPGYGGGRPGLLCECIGKRAEGREPGPALRNDTERAAPAAPHGAAAEENLLGRRGPAGSRFSGSGGFNGSSHPLRAWGELVRSRPWLLLVGAGRFLGPDQRPCLPPSWRASGWGSSTAIMPGWLQLVRARGRAQAGLWQRDKTGKRPTPSGALTPPACPPPWV